MMVLLRSWPCIDDQSRNSENPSLRNVTQYVSTVGTTSLENEDISVQHHQDQLLDSEITTTTVTSNLTAGNGRRETLCQILVGIDGRVLGRNGVTLTGF